MPSYLQPMTCRECGSLIEPSEPPDGKRLAASSYKDCLYQCTCGVGYSNSLNESARTAIWKRLEDNVPPAYRADLSKTLAESVNLTSRTKKADRFGFSTSEDAVSWAIFRWLEEADALAALPKAADLPVPGGAPELLWWGAPRGGGKTKLSQQLASVCFALEEDERRLSEPDVVVSWPEHLFFVEVKYQAANEHKPNYRNFGRYTGEDDAKLFADVAAAQQAGWYELTRNWVIGSRLAAANGQTFTLVNLAPTRIQQSAAEFEKTVVQDGTRNFRFLSWRHFLAAAENETTVPADVQKFIAQRELNRR